MSKPASTVAAGTVVVALLILLASWSKQPEPKHKSRKISFWVQGIRLPSRDSDRFVSTVLDIGPAAVPFLMQEFHHQNSTLRRSRLYRRVWSALPVGIQERLNSPISDGGSMPALAYTLGMIGPAARDAVSVLMRGTDDRTKEVRYYSIWALGQIGAPDAGTVISARLSDSESSVREQAKRALETIALGDRRSE
jgi:HEAT repeat protein